jgi:hypothetical protein
MKLVDIFIVLVLFTLVWNKDFSCQKYDDTDKIIKKSSWFKSPNERSGLYLKKDDLTGCEYLCVPFSGLIPRLDENGKQICRKGE